MKGSLITLYVLYDVVSDLEARCRRMMIVVMVRARCMHEKLT